jgi:hypothetical protein
VASAVDCLKRSLAHGHGYWLIWPEDRRLVAYRLDGDHYRVIATLSEPIRARIPPFDEIELDLAYLLGG